MSDEQSEINLAKLYPPFADKLRQLIAVLGGNWIVDDGFRSFAEQSAYYEQGRSRPGALITRDRAGYSAHNYGVAAHLLPTVEGVVARDNAAFLQLATEAANAGLQWGGNDLSGKFVEMSRVEMVILSMDECLALFKTGGLPAVWATFDAQLGIVKQEVVPEPTPEVAAELAAEIPAEEAVVEVEPEPEVDATPGKKKSPVVERRENAAKAKGKK